MPGVARTEVTACPGRLSPLAAEATDGVARLLCGPIDMCAHSSIENGKPQRIPRNCVTLVSSRPPSWMQDRILTSLLPSQLSPPTHMLLGMSIRLRVILVSSMLRVLSSATSVQLSSATSQLSYV